jgi:O-antigen ligase
LFLLAASIRTERWYQWAGVALLVLAGGPWRPLPANLLGLATILYCTWQLASAIFISPFYAAEGIYQPLMLLGAFVAFATLDRERAAGLFRAGVALLTLLVLLGLVQFVQGAWHLDFGVLRHDDNPLRAAATFVTPNSFATAINLFLVPLAALYVAHGSQRNLALALWLFAGLVATQSRGGMLACLAGLAYVALCLGFPVLRQGWIRVLQLLAGAAAVWVVLAVAGTAFVAEIPKGAALAPASNPWLVRGTAERPELFAATLSLIREHPVAGAGANMFFPLLESVKPAALSGGIYYYAHNDYLQVWLEYGTPGIALLLFIATSALVGAFRAQRRTPADSLPLVCGAALATCFAHAMVDFPLYVPFVLMLTGALLGVLAAHAGDRWPAPKKIVSTRLRWVLALAGLLWLAQPMLAEMAVYRSIAVMERGDARDGIYWQSVARRLEPRHPAHYWAEAIIWRDQAILTRNPLLAAQADALYAEGAKVNRHDAAILLGRIDLHRRHADLLAQPAPPAEVLSWAERAAALRPQSLPAQAELALTLAYAGERERARELARALRQQYPDSALTRRLAAEL